MIDQEVLLPTVVSLGKILIQALYLLIILLPVVLIMPYSYTCVSALLLLLLHFGPDLVSRAICRLLEMPYC